MKRATCILAFLIFAATAVLAQVATIDTRGQKPTMPSLPIGEGGYAGGGNHADLQLSLTLSDPTHLVVDKPFDYELLVTNRSDKPVRLPQALTWSDVNEEARRDLRYLDSTISFEVFVDDGNLGFIHSGFRLYGSESKPATLITVPPGESVRILGSTLFSPQWQRRPANAPSKRLMVFLTVSSTSLKPSKEHPDAFRAEGEQVWNLESDGHLAIEIQEAH